MSIKTQKKTYKGGNVLVPFSLLAALLTSKKTKKCKKCKKCKRKANKRGGNSKNSKEMQFLNNNNSNQVKSFSEWELENSFSNVSKRLLNAAKFKSSDTGTIKGSL